MKGVNWNRIKPGDVLTFYFHSLTRSNICFQFKTWDVYYVYGTLGEKYSRYHLSQATEVGVIR